MSRRAYLMELEALTSIREAICVDGNQVVCTPGGPSATMVALDKQTGALVWKCPRVSDRGAGHASMVLSRVDKTKVYVQTTGSGAMGVRAEDGKLLWTCDFDTTVAVAPNPIVRNDLVFFSAGYGRGGSLLVQVSQGGEIRAKMIYAVRPELGNKHGGIVLMGDTNDHGIPFCADF